MKTSDILFHILTEPQVIINYALIVRTYHLSRPQNLLYKYVYIYIYN